MAVMEIRASEIAGCLCDALIEMLPDQPIRIADGTHPPRNWTVEVNPTGDEISIKAYGAGASWPALIGDFSVAYPQGPKILMLDEPYCATVAEAAERALAALAAAKGDVSRAWLFWGADGTLLDDAEYDEGPVTREHAAAEYAADRDMPAATPEPVPYETLHAIRALCQQARQDGRQITRDDLKGILP